MSGNHNYSSDSRRRTPWDDIDDADKTGTQLFLVEDYTEAYERKHPDLSETNEYKLIKPSKKMTLAAFGDKIAPGSKLIHDGEKSHKILIETLNLIDETHKTAETKGLLDSQNPLRRVNKVHYQTKHFFGKHSGFDRDNINQYLDIFTFIMNPPKQPLEKIETLLNLAFSLRQNIKYRDLFSRGNVSEEAPF